MSGAVAVIPNRLSLRQLEKPVTSIDPEHYRAHPSGVECIQITEHFNFNIGNVIKYVWRAALKGNADEDLRKAKWYLDREIDRLKRENA